MANGVLETDAQNNRCVNGDIRGRYLEIIRAGLLGKLEDANDEILKLESGSVEEKNLINDAERMYKQYGLWNAIDYVYSSEFGLDGLLGIEHQYAYGGYRAVISELGEGAGNTYSQYDFKVHFVDSETGEPTLDGQYIYVDLAKLQEADYAEAGLRIEIDKLEKERREIAARLIVDGITSALEEAFPGISYILPIAESLSEGTFTDEIKGKQVFPYEKYISSYEETTGKKITKDEINLIISAIFKEQELNAQIDRAEDEIWHLIFSQGISMDVNLCDSQGVSLESNEIIAGSGILLPQAKKNLHKWETGGIEAVLEDMGMDELVIDDKVEKLREINVGQENWEILLNGGDISGMQVSELSDYIKDIEGKLGVEYDISMWLKKGVSSNE